MMTLEMPVLSQAEKTIVWPLLSRLQERAQRLEEEAAALRNDVTQMAQALDQPVATYAVDGEEYRLTARDVAAVKARLLKPHSEEAIRTIALSEKIAERQRHMTYDELHRRFRANVEAIRIQAIADGTAIYDPVEATIGD
jgi:lysozyme family protein